MRRRDILQNVGLLAGATALAPGITSADESKIEREKLPPKESKSFVGAVMSSPYFKSVRDQLKEAGFKISPGQGISERIKNKEEEERVRELIIPGKNKKDSLDVAVRAIETPSGELNVIGLVTDPESDDSPLVSQFVSNESAHKNTETGCYITHAEEDEN